MRPDLFHRAVPVRALFLSGAALLLPVLGAFLVPDQLADYGTFLWLLALVPAFLLAYYRGWRGVATALAAGMATLSITQVVAVWLGSPPPDILLGVVTAYVVVALGVGWMASALHRERADVESMAFTDLLTHLPNRRHARIFLDNEFASAERGRGLSVVLFDLDRFKDYNDNHGHAAGDAALKAFADILTETTRRMDLSARFGGEEFLSTLAGTDTEGAVVFADRIRRAWTEVRHEGSARLTVSAGVASYHPTMRSPDELLAAADHALYQAKRDGRNRVRLYGRSLMDHAMPSSDADQGLDPTSRPEALEYPRPDEDIGRTRPPLTLLPHQITGFGAGRSVLVVEDDSQVRALVTTYLTREGFSVTEAADVDSGVDELALDFDVVLTDLRLPGEPGTAMVSAVKSRWPTTQVVIITGIHDVRVAAEALNAGADQYLSKPFGMPDLRRHLIDALHRRDGLRIRRQRRESAEPTPGSSRRARTRAAILRAALFLREAVETHEPFQAGHGERVAEYSACLLPEITDRTGVLLDAEGLGLGCRLHDVGKLGVDDELLNQDRTLTGEEFGRLRAHPSLGRRMLEPILDDDMVLAIVSWHHERWDGTGYPDGLAGRSIPLCARLVAVTDALDAMTSDRPHRQARPWDEAVREVVSESGTHFDPTVIEAFEARLDDLYDVYTRMHPTRVFED